MASPQRASREIVEFPPNLPVTVSLQYGQGKLISNQHGERMMYSTTDGRVMFLDLDVAAQIEAAGINVRESFTITKQTDGHKASPVFWKIERVAGEQPNGTFAVPALSKPPASAATSTGGIRHSLVEEANALVDDFAVVLQHALDRHQGRIKPEDARTLLITAYIQRGKSAA